MVISMGVYLLCSKSELKDRYKLQAGSMKDQRPRFSGASVVCGVGEFGFESGGADEIHCLDVVVSQYAERCFTTDFSKSSCEKPPACGHSFYGSEGVFRSASALFERSMRISSHCALLFVSPQGLWDLSGRSDFPHWSPNLADQARIGPKMRIHSFQRVLMQMAADEATLCGGTSRLE